MFVSSAHLLKSEWYKISLALDKVDKQIQKVFHIFKWIFFIYLKLFNFKSFFSKIVEEVIDIINSKQAGTSTKTYQMCLL